MSNTEYNVFLDLIFPGIIVTTGYRSFLAPLFVHPKLPVLLRSMLTCPLCLGFHMSWIWLVFRVLIVTGSSVHEEISLLHWLVLPFAGGLVSYCLEHCIALVVNLEQFYAVMAASSDADDDDSDSANDLVLETKEVDVEERRRG